MKLTLVNNKGNLESLLAETARDIPPSGIRKFFDIVYSTPDCISLGVGEPDFVTPWRISDTGIFAIKDGYTHYTPNRGLLELRNLITAAIEKQHGVSYSPEDEVVVTMGVSQGLDIALRSIVNPGDEVIIIEPCYVSYEANIRLIGGVAVGIPSFAGENFRIDINRLKKAITPKTKAILLNYPSNPTGSSIDSDTMTAIARIAVKNNLIIFSDEIYSSIIYENEHKSIISLPGMKERTVYLNGFSKSHAMTGWRLGYVAGPQYLIDVLLKIHQYTALCAPSISQYAAIEAVQSADREVAHMRAEYTKRRNFIVSRFNEAGLPCLSPQGAFYVFPDVSPTGLSSEDFAMKLLNEQKVAVVPGGVFGACGTNHIRCSFANSMENIRTAMKRIDKFVKSL
ncbi:MAG TPA: aminotransferase class I/II-fold pyridoxal phosphate-dependent enzyme [Spirochaetota bacterium]|nr:aminotransferase class I/II-fold pyridoxal phosphate-dependent enzyme [Spirochaetota bacterium]